MAERKETPRKVYPKSAIDSGCKCRLCGGIFEKARCKNLFKKGNEGRLRSDYLRTKKYIPNKLPASALK
jgi:hypothetical protein